MKLSVAVFATALGLAAAKKHRDVTPKSAIKATSKTGQKMMSKARRVEQDENEEIDFTWVANMSLKFQGCYHDQIFNAEADGDEDIKVSTQRLVRFRLCPSDTCTMESAGGCSSGYGDYIISMDQYLESYFEAIEQDQEYSCEYEKEYGDCICDQDDDGFDEEICEYDCYMGKGMEYCVDNNPYAEEGEEEEEEEMDMREMAECRELEIEDNDDNNRRRLDEEEEVQYFVGAYCSDSGASIHLGVFTEETCSQFADAYGGSPTYSTLTGGKELPYASSTMIGTECMSCKEPEDADQNNDNDNEDEDQVKEGCEELYQSAGKCEYGLSGSVQYPNNAACNYMEGIKIVRKNGTIVSGPGSKNGTASVFIGLFSCSFILLGGYAYYLKTKLDRAKVNLVSEE